MLNRDGADLAPVSEPDADRAFAILSHENSVVLAVSGGPDSMAMLWLAAAWRNRAPESRPHLSAITIDHGWRPEAAAEADMVSVLCARLGIPHQTIRLDGEPPLTRREERARTARYEQLFAACRAKGAALATAHTSDDQAETVLMRIAAGSGPSGLAAMRPVSASAGVPHYRPFLDLPKAALVETLRVARIAFAEDPTNRDPAFARGRLRLSRDVLAREGLTDARLAVLAGRMARADRAIEAATDALAASAMSKAGDGLSLRTDAFFSAPEEIALRLLGRAIFQVTGIQPRLALLESLFATLQAANTGEEKLARTLAGARIALSLQSGAIRIEKAPPRRKSASINADRGKKSASLLTRPEH